MKIWVNGCFDILHTGHLDLLEFAKKLDFVEGEGYSNPNTLIVGIDSDDRVKELKGDDRPINDESDRIRFLKALHFVDEVIIFDSSDELRELIKLLRIDVMIVGDEYVDREVIGSENSKNGVVYYPVDSRSSTDIIEKIKLL